MANAIARTSYVTFREGEGLIVGLDCYFTGVDVPGGVLPQTVEAIIQPTDQPAAIRSAMSSAVSAVAAASGFTCQGTNMTLPTFQKG